MEGKNIPKSMPQKLGWNSQAISKNLSLINPLKMQLKLYPQYWVLFLKALQPTHSELNTFFFYRL